MAKNYIRKPYPSEEEEYYTDDDAELDDDGNIITSGKVEYIEDGKGGVIKVEPDGTETLVIAPSEGFFKPAKEPALNKRLIDEYLEWRRTRGGANEDTSAGAYPPMQPSRRPRRIGD